MWKRLQVCDKNRNQIHCVHSILKFIGKTYENWGHEIVKNTPPSVIDAYYVCPLGWW